MDDPDALLNCYVREIKDNFENNIPFRILLIFNNAPRHPPLIGDTYPNMKVIVLSPSTISLIQPTDSGVRAAYKAYHLRRTFAQAITVTEKDSDALLEELQHL